MTVTATAPRDWDARQTAFYTQRWGGKPDDTVTITFDDGPQKLRAVSVSSGEANMPETRLTHAVLESSEDGKTFTPLTTFDAVGSAQGDLGGKPVAAIRIRFTALQTPHPIIKTVVLN